jgi:hypothetical protein
MLPPSLLFIFSITTFNKLGRSGMEDLGGGMFRAPPSLRRVSEGDRVSQAGTRYSTMLVEHGRPSIVPFPLIEDEAEFVALVEKEWDAFEEEDHGVLKEEAPAPRNRGVRESMEIVPSAPPTTKEHLVGGGMFRDAPPSLGRVSDRCRVSQAGTRYSTMVDHGRPSTVRPRPLIDEAEFATLVEKEEEWDAFAFEEEDRGVLKEEAPAPRNRGVRGSMEMVSSAPTTTKEKNVFPSWTQRKHKGRSFVRTRHSHAEFEARKSEVVMSTPTAEDEPWEAYLEPGTYQLSDIVLFPDVDEPVPRCAKFYVPKANWKCSGDKTSGTVKIDHNELKQPIPVEIATDLLLKFYGCSLISRNSAGQVHLYDEHVIQDFHYSKDYFKKYVTGVGAGVETHDFAHIDCPLSPLHESGFFLLGKWEEEEGKTCLCLTMFRVPQGHALFVPGGTIHSNDYMRGAWRTMLSWTCDQPINHVTLLSIEADGSLNKEYFKVKGVDLFE